MYSIKFFNKVYINLQIKPNWEHVLWYSLSVIIRERVLRSVSQWNKYSKYCYLILFRDFKPEIRSLYIPDGLSLTVYDQNDFLGNSK